jgi:UDP-N-acetylglucosamine acyltransferase
MVAAHVAHDCVLHDRVVLTNNVMLAGHVEVGQGAYVGGGAAIHQFVRLGKGSMTGGGARITQDVAPFLMVAERNELSGLNLLGLKRRGVPREVIREIKALFHLFFEQKGNIRAQAREALERLAPAAGSELHEFLSFFLEGKRGFAGVKLKSGRRESGDSGEES